MALTHETGGYEIAVILRTRLREARLGFECGCGAVPCLLTTWSFGISVCSVLSILSAGVCYRRLSVVISAPQTVMGLPKAPSLTTLRENRLNSMHRAPCLSPLSIQAALALRDCLGPSRVPEQLFLLVPVQNNQQIEFFLLTLKKTLASARRIKPIYEVISSAKTFPSPPSSHLRSILFQLHSFFRPWVYSTLHLL